MATKKRFKAPSSHRQMIKSVLAWVFAPANTGTTNSIPAFASAMTTLQSKSDNIDALCALRSRVITGIAAQKQSARIALAQTSYPIMSAVRAFAINQNDQTLANNMKVTLSGLQRMPFLDLADRITAAIATVTPLVSGLSAYNITSSNITNWTSVLTTLSDLLTGPRSAVTSRKSINIRITDALFDIMVYLRSTCDTTVTLFMAANNAFYKGYIINRKLIPVGHISTQLRLHVVDPAGNPVTQGIVYVIGDDTNSQGNLDANGYCLVNYIHFGNNTITVTAPAGTQNYGPHVFKQGHSLTLHLTFNPSDQNALSTVKSEETPVAVIN